MSGDHGRRLSGTNITVIVVALCAAIVLAPIGAMAASGQLVNITDPGHKNQKARVSTKGSLITSLRDAATGANAKVDAAGEQLVSVPGSVTAHVADPTTGVGAKVTPGGSELVSVANSPNTMLRDPTTGTQAKVNSTGNLMVAVGTQVRTVPGSLTSINSNGLNNGLTVPAGKHMVVTTVSIDTTVSAGGSLEVFLRYTSGGNSGYLFIPMTRAGTASTGYDEYVATVPVQIYADPGTPVYADADALSGNLGGSMFCTVSGYLV
jgi:hypothetical protein